MVDRDLPAAPVPDAVLVGRIVGLYGVRGWIRVRSFTEPPENIFCYAPWTLAWDGPQAASAEFALADKRRHGKGLVAQLAGIEDRDAAAGLVGADVWVDRQQLGSPDAGHWYWSDLVGLAVETRDGIPLGTVEQLLATGANDVLVVAGDRRRLIPFVTGSVIDTVDLDGRRIVVEWEPDF